MDSTGLDDFNGFDVTNNPKNDVAESIYLALKYFYGERNNFSPRISLPVSEFGLQEWRHIYSVSDPLGGYF